MKKTTLEIIRERASFVKDEGIKLIKSSSGMCPVNTPNSKLVFLSANGNYFWNENSTEGKRIQAKLIPKINNFIELIRTLSMNLPGGVQQDIKGSLETIRNSIIQENATWWKDMNEAVAGYQSLIEKVIGTLEEYYERASGAIFAIVDTNVLLENPDIENWRFDSIDHFTVALTPVVLSELDRHKINHKNEEVRKKTNMIINKIKEYRRRGSLNDGVSVVNNKISIRSIAIEPDMTKSLLWFDPINADDRFLATSIEVMRNDLGAKVFIVTADINLQNKAKMAGLPFREVPK